MRRLRCFNWFSRHTLLVQMLNTTYADMLAAGRAEGNPTVRYSLAVVRAAIPAHAQLATLNATINSGGTVEVKTPPLEPRVIPVLQ